jgi:guanylate kinase
MSSNHGHLIVVTAPSGAGKSTLVQGVVEQLPNLTYSVSYTTRDLRGDEKEGRQYFFVTVDEFLEKRDGGGFIECAEVHGNWYGTPRDGINAHLEAGRDVILDIDVQGAAQIRKQMSDAITIFILPPSFAVLENRLRNRNTDNRYNIEKRLQNARLEVDQYCDFDYLIVNEDLATALNGLVAIITAARHRRECQEKTAQAILKTFHENTGGETVHA